MYEQLKKKLGIGSHLKVSYNFFFKGKSEKNKKVWNKLDLVTNKTVEFFLLKEN